MPAPVQEDRAAPVIRASRLSALLLAGALAASAAGPAPAQSNVVAPPPPPRSDTVGSEELRNFSLGGNQQRSEQPAPPLQQPTTRQPAPAPAPAPSEREAPAPVRQAPSAATTSRTTAVPTPSERTAAPAPLAPAGTSAPGSQVSEPLPPPTPAPSAPIDFGAGSGVPPITGSSVDSAPLTSSSSGMGYWPWLAAGLALVAGLLFFLFQRRRAEPEPAFDGGGLAFAGGPPPPAPEPRAQPVPRAAPVPAPPPVTRPPEEAAVPPAAPAPAAAPVPANPKGVGIVSTRLRPWLDLDVAVTSAVLTEEALELHLQLAAVNSGSTPARQVGIEVVALNAGPEQERELAAYFERPDPDPQAAEMIPPLDQVLLQTVVRMPRDMFREYAAGEGRVLVPLIAVNAAYRAGTGTGRTSAAFMIGRGNAESEKLGPLRTDLGPRQMSGIVARRIAGGIRR